MSNQGQESTGNRPEVQNRHLELKDLSTRKYLDETVVPILTEGLAILGKVKKIMQNEKTWISVKKEIKKKINLQNHFFNYYSKTFDAVF